MDRQDVYNRVVRGLASQGFVRSICDIIIEDRVTGEDTISGICAYRGRENRRCAIGYLIPDEKYDKHLERTSISINPNKDLVNALDVGEIGVSDLCFLEELQQIHDRGASPNLMRSRLKYFGRLNNLQWPFDLVEPGL